MPGTLPFPAAVAREPRSRRACAHAPRSAPCKAPSYPAGSWAAGPGRAGLLAAGPTLLGLWSERAPRRQRRGPFKAEGSDPSCSAGFPGQRGHVASHVRLAQSRSSQAGPAWPGGTRAGGWPGTCDSASRWGPAALRWVPGTWGPGDMQVEEVAQAWRLTRGKACMWPLLCVALLSPDPGQGRSSGAGPCQLGYGRRFSRKVAEAQTGFPPASMLVRAGGRPAPALVPGAWDSDPEKAYAPSIVLRGAVPGLGRAWLFSRGNPPRRSCLGPMGQARPQPL